MIFFWRLKCRICSKLSQTYLKPQDSIIFADNSNVPSLLPEQKGVKNMEKYTCSLPNTKTNIVKSKRLMRIIASRRISTDSGYSLTICQEQQLFEANQLILLLLRKLASIVFTIHSFILWSQGEKG
jgi:hypothetical protein